MCLTVILSIDDYEYESETEDTHTDNDQHTRLEHWVPLQLLGTKGRDGKKLYLNFIHSK